MTSERSPCPESQRCSEVKPEEGPNLETPSTVATLRQCVYQLFWPWECSCLHSHSPSPTHTALKPACTPHLKISPPWIYKKESQKAIVVDSVQLDTATKVSRRTGHSSVPDAALTTPMSQTAESAEKRTFGRITAHLLLSS